MVSLFNMEKDIKLKEVRDEVVDCQKCSLYKTRNLPVIGEGNHQAKIIFIGEAPGAQEDKTGKPFCGTSGRILDELLESVGIDRKDVYIANILKDRPPGNRDPLPDEIQACVSYLKKQIEIIKPKVICPLGRYSMNFLMEEYGLKDSIEGISKIHGKVFDVSSEIKLIPFYHPAVAAYNGSMKETLKEDFKVLKQFK